MADEPADGAREPQVLARALGPGAPAHAARDLQAGDEARDQLGHDLARRPPLGLDAHEDELRAVDHLATDVLGRRALGAREPGARLGERAVLGVGDLGLGAAELLDLGQLLRGHAVDQDGDAARRDQDPGRRALLEQALAAEQREREPRLLRRALELPDHRLADLVRQLLAADLDEQRAQCAWPRSSRRLSPASRVLSAAPVADDLQVEAGDLAREVAHAGDVRGAVGHADHAARVEHVERVAALEHVVVGGDGQARLDGAQRLGLVLAEVAVEHLRVRHLEVVGAELALVLLVDVAVGDDVLRAVLVPARPDEVVDAVHALQVHRQALEAVGDLDGDGVEVEAAQLLEVGELGGLHAVDPDLPALAPGAERGALPVVLDEAHVVLGEVDAEGLERAQVHVLDVGRRRLDDHLVLVVVAEAVRVLAVAPVGGAHGRLDVGGAPGTGVEAAQERRGVEGAGADLGVVRLHDDAALPLPEGLQAADDLLERGGRGGCGLGVVGHVSFRVGSAILPVSRRSEQTAGVPRSGRMFHTCGRPAAGTVDSSRSGCERRGRSGRRDCDANAYGWCDCDASAGPTGMRRPYRSTATRRTSAIDRRLCPRQRVLLSTPWRARRSAAAGDAQRAQARAGVVGVELVDVAQRLAGGVGGRLQAQLRERPRQRVAPAPRWPPA